MINQNNVTVFKEIIDKGQPWDYLGVGIIRQEF